MGAHTDKEARIESSFTTKWLFGIACGWDEAIAWIREQSVTAFRENRDKDAYLLRALAEKAKEEAKTAHCAADRHAEERAQMTEEDWK